MTKILYLHGFLSSPLSTKVMQLRHGAGDAFEVIAPDLNMTPGEVDALLDNLVRDHQATSSESLVVVGSSLGGFYAARLATKFGLRCVLLNPCFNPWGFVKAHTGVQTIFGTDRTLDVRPTFVDDLQKLAENVSPLDVNPQRTLVPSLEPRMKFWIGRGRGSSLCRLSTGGIAWRRPSHFTV